MGYVRKKTFKLVFADPEFEGLEVRTKSMAVGKLLEMAKLAGIKQAGALGLDAVIELFTTFAGVLVDWNVETEEGHPVPATLEGVLSQDQEFVMSIIMAWMDAVGGIPAPLEPRSSDGEPSLEASLPMEVSSPSLTS